jgi:hypothetical protein
MDPTPTWDSSISSPSSPSSVFGFLAVFFLAGGADSTEPLSVDELGCANALALLNPGGADASTTAS